MLLPLLALAALGATAAALPAQQVVLTAPFTLSPLATSAAPHDSSFTPLLPPAIPLAVKSPYLNAVLSAGGEGGSKGYLAGSWARHWPVHYPGSPKDYRLSWAGLISIDGETFEFLGAPLSDPASGFSSPKQAKQLAFEYTATRSIFSFQAGGVEFNATFLTTVTPNDYVRQSLPFSYLILDIDAGTVKNKTVTVYTDISGEWASGNSDSEITWEYTCRSGVGAHLISRKTPQPFTEFAEQAEWGKAVYATSLVDGVVAGSGSASSLRKQFVQHGRLAGSQNFRYRRINDDQPVFGFSAPLNKKSSSVVFTIGHVRDPYITYITPHGQLPVSGLWTTRFPDYFDALVFFQSSAARHLSEAVRFDARLRADAQRISGDSYAAIVELSTRQAFATLEVTNGVTEDWKEDKEGGVFVTLKEISSNGDAQTIDVIFPLHPILLYTNPTLLALLLEPLLVYTRSGMYPNRWPVHDLGTYPVFRGYNDGSDEPMPLEEGGNMLWMALAYYQLSGDRPWVEKNYDVLKQWTAYLIDDGLVPAEQLSTDDFAGALANQTDLAVKAIVGIGAMGELAKQVGRFTDHVHFSSVAKAYVVEWSKMALTEEGGSLHAKLAYQDEGSWGLLYNLFGDRLLGLDLFDRSLYKHQADWYRGKAEKYGVPLDSRHPWTKSDWELFAAASATDPQTRDLFVDKLVEYLKAGKVDAAFPDLYETPTADFPGRGLDWPVLFLSRPVVGGHFALLALEKTLGREGYAKAFGGEKP
ncbi:hypothetical protein JCM8097_006615 [Rhodosporidiobolus ruineniae]